VRRSALFWAILTVFLAAVVLYGPGRLAAASTGPGEPVNFLSNPLDGWRFMVDAARHIGSARAATPSAAARIAAHDFAGSGVTAERVDLLWLPSRRISLATGKGRTTVVANGRLVWTVTGRLTPDGPPRTVGVLDYDSGRLIFQRGLSP
jgi:hypothetical protein